MTWNMPKGVVWGDVGGLDALKRGEKTMTNEQRLNELRKLKDGDACWLIGLNNMYDTDEPWTIEKHEFVSLDPDWYVNYKDAKYCMPSGTPAHVIFANKQDAIDAILPHLNEALEAAKVTVLELEKKKGALCFESS